MSDELQPIDVSQHGHDVDVSLFGGNGLEIQMGFDSSSLAIAERIKQNDPDSYDEDFGDLDDTFEFEQYLAGKSDYEVTIIKRDLVVALISPYREAMIDCEAAVDFARRFDAVYTLNFDPMMAMLYAEVNNEENFSIRTQSLFMAETDANMHGFQTKKEKGRASNDITRSPLSGQSLGKTLLSRDARIRTAMAQQDESGTSSNEEPQWFDGFIDIDEKSTSLPGEAKRGVTFKYVHGAFHIVEIDENGSTKFHKLSSYEELMSLKYDVYFAGRAAKILIVLSNDPEVKHREIMSKDYLKSCCLSLSEITGVLYVHGLDIYKDTDLHIWRMLNTCRNIKFHIAQDKSRPEFKQRMQVLLPDHDDVEAFDRNIR